MSHKNISNTIDEAEIEKFSKIADEWWSETGKFKPLHKFNPCRISYIIEQLTQLNTHKTDYGCLTSPSAEDKNSYLPLKNLQILDVGCGGGLLCEPLSRLGADVVGIDAGEKNIKAAKIHANGLKIDYRSQDVEELAKTSEKFDVVLAMEVAEHVLDVKKFLFAAKSCLKPGGLMFVATLNRTAKSYLKAILGAEYILRWLPIGTHNWKKFLKPSEIHHHISNDTDNDSGLELVDLSGFSYNLLKDEWKKSEDLSVNYVMVFKWNPTTNHP